MSTRLPGSTLAPLSVQDVGRELLTQSAEKQNRFGTGWSIDDTCGMVGVGELALWVARSGSGKSTAYLNIIRNTPEVPTLVVNMEMTPTRQLEWLLSMTFDMETPARSIEDVLRSGGDDPRYEEVRSNLAWLEECYPSLNFARPEQPTVEDIETLIEDIADATGIQPVRLFIDHVGLMKGCEDYQGMVRTCSGLHALAMRKECSIWGLQQTARGGGDQGRNDGHLALTMASGMYGGEADADWVFGMYRPDRNPKFKKTYHQFDDPNDWYRMQDQLKEVEGITILQVLKNRPFADLNETGIQVKYDPHSRRLSELGAY